MNKFLKRLSFYYLLPILFLVIGLVIWDPFRVFFEYEDYYNDNHITGNRENICFNLLEGREVGPKNFILGNSRSHAFKTSYFADVIGVEQESCFHYDGSGLGLYRARNAVDYICQNYEVENFLIVTDLDFFAETVPPKGHLFIQNPIVSGSSMLEFYWSFLRSSLDPVFIFYNLVYFLSGQYFDFMGFHISNSENFHSCNHLTGDLDYSYDIDLETDSLSYYSRLLEKGTFYVRSDKEVIAERVIRKEQLELLEEIRDLLEGRGVEPVVVIAPLYNQRKLNLQDVHILETIFGCENVFDFSGKNSYTEDFRNYYETSHFKQNVANGILDSIYKERNL